MSKYQRLTQAERYQIYVLLKANHSQVDIANILNRHKSTISREINRNHGLRGYRPKQAQRLADSRQVGKAKERLGSALWEDEVPGHP